MTTPTNMNPARIQVPVRTAANTIRDKDFMQD